MRERLVISVFLAILVHFIVLLVLQLVLKLEQTRIPEYSGPLYVTLGETPEESPVIEKAEEPRQLPPMEREQPRVEESSADPAQGSVTTRRPLLRPVTTPETAPETTSRPRTGLRFLDPPQTPGSDDPPLPADPEGYQPPPAEVLPPREPTPSEGAPVAQQPEVRPEEESAPESVLDLDSLDSSLTPSSDTGSRSGSAEGGPSTRQTTGTRSTSAREGREGIPILFDDPSLGRDPTSTPRPQIPDWVSEQGLRLQVVVSFELTPQGVLRDVKVEEGSGYPDVDAAVLDALRRWKFPPVTSSRTVTGRVPYTIIPN